MRFLLSSHGASLFGAERVLIGIGSGLAARGHAVTLEFPHQGPAVGVARELGLAVTVSERPRLPRNVVELIRYATGFRNSVLTVRRTIHAGEYDILWINSIYNAPASLAASDRDVAVVWHLHERNFRGLLAPLAALWIRRHCDVALAPSAFVARTFAAGGLGAPCLRVVPNALVRPMPEESTRRDSGRFVVGYIGQLEIRKRVGDVLEALARIDDATALIVGDGKARPQIEAAIERLGISGRVCLAGYQEDVGELLAHCHCMVIPSANEAFGLVALEAMAAGRPVAAARSGALPEVLGSAALYFPPGDVAALAECLKRLRDDDGLVARLRARGLARVRRYTLQKMVDDVEAVALEAVVRHGRSARIVERDA